MRLGRFGIWVCAVVALPGLVGRASGALVLQLKASNYANGVWTDTSGNGDNATYSGSSTPTLVLGATPNGSAAVNLTGSGSLVLATPLAATNGYTVFAYLVPTASSNTARNAIVGGSASTALEWDIYKHQDDFLTEYTADIAHGTGTLSTTAFSLIDLAVTSSGSSFNLNGSSDGTGAGASFGNSIARIGNNEGGGDGFVGQIAEIDIYSGTPASNGSPASISAVEAQLTTAYVPEPASLGFMVMGAAGMLRRRRA